MIKNSNSLSAQRIEHLFAEIAKTITGSLDTSKIISAVMKEVDLFYHPDNWSLLIVDPVSKELYFAVAKGMKKHLIKNVHLKLGEGIAGYVAKSGRELYVPDVTRDYRFSHKVDELSGFTTKSVIAMPIVYQKEVLGVIELINIEVRKFSIREIAILKTIADFCAIALTNANAYNYVTNLSNHDPLTGVYNRKYLDQFVLENKKAIGSDHHIIVAWIDIDFFKMVNDQYGHTTGDLVLKKLAGILQNCKHIKNHIFRVGGDEFLIVVPNIKKHELASTTTHLMNELKEYSQQIHPAKSFSFGIATGLDSKCHEVIMEADRALYKNKHSEQV